MAQAAIILREKRRKERRNTLQPSVDDDNESQLPSQLLQLAAAAKGKGKILTKLLKNILKL